MDITDIILQENEHSALDFKAEQYVKGNYHSLLKDVIAMANAVTKGEKYIILGVKHKPGEEREIKGVDADFVDDATYQQIITENIEPELTIKYYPVYIESKKVGVLEILDSNNPPYMMSKLFTSNEKGKTLNAGDSWIRIGSQQQRLTRKHIDKYISQILKRHVNDLSFQGELEVVLTNAQAGDNTLRVRQLSELPSAVQAKRIRNAIEKKEGISPNHHPAIASLVKFQEMTSWYRATNYDTRDLETLKNDLANVENTYKEHDLHFRYELAANKVNFTVHTKGNKYLEDATIVIFIEKSKGLSISRRVYQKPDDRSFSPTLRAQPSLENGFYPQFTETDREYKFEETLGDLKHGLDKPVFRVPIRVLITPEFDFPILPITCKIYGRNLPTPLEFLLNIKIL